MRLAVVAVTVGLGLGATPAAADVPSPAQLACTGREVSADCSYTNEPPYGTGHHSGSCVELEHPMKPGVMFMHCEAEDGQEGPPPEEGSRAGCAGCTLAPPGPGTAGLALALALLGLLWVRQWSWRRAVPS